MKYTLALFFVLFNVTSFSQITDTLINQHNKKSGVVTFITKVDMANATKDGIYLNGYVVNIDRNKAKQLHGKTIRVTGKVTSLKGIKDVPHRGFQQGRAVETKYIKSPKIQIIEPQL